LAQSQPGKLKLVSFAAQLTGLILGKVAAPVAIDLSCLAAKVDLDRPSAASL